jgi:transcriptional regulator with XRE-family HTH domain
MLSEPLPFRERDTVVTDLSVLGALIAWRRRALGLTLDEASERLGVGRRLLTELEHGKRSVRAETLLRLLNLLGFDLVVRARGTGESRAGESRA